MEKFLQTLRYLAKSFTAMTVIGFLSMLGGLAISDLVFYLTDRYNAIHEVATLTSPMDITAAIFALIIGIVLFIINLNVTMANGITRKTYLLANLPVAGLVAAALAIFNVLVVQVHALFWPIIMTSSRFYPGSHWTGLLIVQFALYLLLIVLGWFITMAYYRSRVPARWAISLSPVVLFALLEAANARFDGAVLRAIGEYLQVSLGLEAGNPNPYRAAVSMLAYSILLSGLVYLLIRRAPLKD